MNHNKSTRDIMNIFDDKKLVKICAPMVRYSKLQFRTLVREYGCDLCFTPMILADSFCQSQKARDNEFSTSLNDTPLVAQFAANTVHDFVGAAYLASPYCNGADLNCGCPQRWAKSQGIGCIMLEQPELISDLVKQCRNHISKPFTVSVKMRILSDIKKTVSICQQLEHSGVSFLSVHSRTASQGSVGPVNIEALRLITESVNCPVIANGGIKTLDEALQLQEETSCKGVMVASGILTNPALFSGSNVTPMDCIQNWVDICYNSTLDPNIEFYNNDICTFNTLSISNRPKNLTFQCFHHHLVFMLEKVLPKSLRKVFNDLQTFESVLEFLNEHFNIRPRLFSIEKYRECSNLLTNYENRNDKYLELRNEADDSFKFEVRYNPDLNEGSFFSSKKCIDNNDTCISSLFIEN